MQIPDIREGDTLRPGMPVADILDLSELEVLARVGELDRANLHEGQEVSITLDAVPEQQVSRHDQDHERHGEFGNLQRRPFQEIRRGLRHRHEATDDGARARSRNRSAR